MVVHCPGSDLLNFGWPDTLPEEFWGSSHPFSDFHSWEEEAQRFERIVDPEMMRGLLLRQCSPITHLISETPPTLLLHGDEDELIPLQQSECSLIAPDAELRYGPADGRDGRIGYVTPADAQAGDRSGESGRCLMDYQEPVVGRGPWYIVGSGGIQNRRCEYIHSTARCSIRALVSLGRDHNVYLKRHVVGLEVRQMETIWKDHIESNPAVLRGKPCVKNTRIPVALVLGYLAGGHTADEIIAEFPDLTAESVVACLDYARELAEFEIAA